MKFAKAVNKYHKAVKETHKARIKESLSKDPKVASVEKKLYDLAERVKEEGIDNA